MRGVKASTAAPTGTFTKKIHSQPRYFVNTPPASTPTAAPLPPSAPQIPRALFRSVPSSKLVITIESAAGVMIAPPRPCTARATISIPSDCANPQTSEASVNSATPTMNTRRRPSRSAARPPSSRKPPKAIEYAVITHCRFSREKSRARPMDGSATLTIETSRIVMKNAVATTARIRQRWGFDVIALGYSEGRPLGNRAAEDGQEPLVVLVVSDRDADAASHWSHGEPSLEQGARELLRFVDPHVEKGRVRRKRLVAELAQTGCDSLALVEERAYLGRGLQRRDRERCGEGRQRRGMLALIQLCGDVAACEGIPHPGAGEPEHLRERAQHDHAFVDQAGGRLARVFEVRLVD